MNNNISDIILTAGFSTRMSRVKPLLPRGDETVIERIIVTFQKAGVSDVRVVVGYRMEELIPMIERANAHVVINTRYSEGMFSSVQAGVKSVPMDSEAFFVHPVDIPMICPSTITKIMDRHADHEDCIIYPCHNGRRGHPPLVPSRFSEAIMSANIFGKLNDVLAYFAKDSMDLEVEDANILFNMNHARDYREKVSSLKQRKGLTREQTEW